MGDRTVADVVVARLLAAGVPRIFAPPTLVHDHHETNSAADRPADIGAGRRIAGGAEDAVIAAAERHGIVVIQAASERSAAVMAAVTADFTGTPGVVLVTGDAASAFEGLRQALVDRSAVVAIARSMTAATAVSSAVKTCVDLSRERPAESIEGAIVISRRDPRGPVLVVAPPEVLGAPVDAAVHASAGPPTFAEARPSPPADLIDGFADLLAKSARPVIVAGLETRSADDAGWLRAFAEALPAPVIVTPRARGGIPEPHPLAFGVLGDESASAAVLGRADLIVTLGLDPAETGAALWSAPTLRLARSPARDTCMAPTREIVGDIGLVLEELAPRLRGRARADWDVAELDRLRRTARSSEASDPLYAAVESVVRMTREITPSGAIAVFEAALAPSSRRWQCVAPGDLIVPTLPAFSGFAVPAAIAASLSSPDAPVLCFTDAAGFRDATPDLETAKSVDAGIVVIVMNERAEKLARDVVRVSPDGAWSEVLDRAASARHPIVVEVALER